MRKILPAFDASHYLYSQNNNQADWIVNVYPNGSERGIMTDRDIGRIVECTYKRQ